MSLDPRKKPVPGSVSYQKESDTLAVACKVCLRLCLHLTHCSCRQLTNYVQKVVQTELMLDGWCEVKTGSNENHHLGRKSLNLRVSPPVLMADVTSGSLLSGRLGRLQGRAPEETPDGC